VLADFDLNPLNWGKRVGTIDNSVVAISADYSVSMGGNYDKAGKGNLPKFKQIFNGTKVTTITVPFCEIWGQSCFSIVAL
jgi:hypothetical protein